MILTKKLNLLQLLSSKRLSTLSKDKQIEYLGQILKPFNKPNAYESLISKKPSLAALTRSAILIPISVREERNKEGVYVPKTYFTMTKRSENIKLLKGVCCFLGGKRDPSDPDDVTTAIREAYEELGVESDRLTVLCELGPMMAFAGQSGFLFTPVVAHFNRDGFVSKCNQDEVEFEFEVETEIFLSGENYQRKSVFSHKREHYFHYFNVDLAEQRRRVSIWGMTSYMAIMVASMIHSRLPSFEFDPERKLDGKNFNEFNEWYILDKGDKFLEDLIKEENKITEFK